MFGFIRIQVKFGIGIILLQLLMITAYLPEHAKIAIVPA